MKRTIPEIYEDTIVHHGFEIEHTRTHCAKSVKGVDFSVKFRIVKNSLNLEIAELYNTEILEFGLKLWGKTLPKSPIRRTSWGLITSLFYLTKNFSIESILDEYSLKKGLALMEDLSIQQASSINAILARTEEEAELVWKNKLTNRAPVFEIMALIYGQQGRFEEAVNACDRWRSLHDIGPFTLQTVDLAKKFYLESMKTH